MRTAFRFISGLVFGALLGGILGLLFAPASGNILRERVNNYFIETSNEVRNAAQLKREELEQELAKLRGPQA